MYASLCKLLYVHFCMYTSVCTLLYVCFFMYTSVCTLLYVRFCMYISVCMLMYIRFCMYPSVCTLLYVCLQALFGSFFRLPQSLQNALKMYSKCLKNTFKMSDFLLILSEFFTFCPVRANQVLVVTGLTYLYFQKQLAFS